MNLCITALSHGVWARDVSDGPSGKQRPRRGYREHTVCGVTSERRTRKTPEGQGSRPLWLRAESPRPAQQQVPGQSPAVGGNVQAFVPSSGLATGGTAPRSAGSWLKSQRSPVSRHLTSDGWPHSSQPEGECDPRRRDCCFPCCPVGRRRGLAFWGLQLSSQPPGVSSAPGSGSLPKRDWEPLSPPVSPLGAMLSETPPSHLPQTSELCGAASRSPRLAFQ